MLPVLVVNLCFYFFVFIPALVQPFYSIKLCMYIDRFSKFFTGTLCVKVVINWLLRMPPHQKGQWVSK